MYLCVTKSVLIMCNIYKCNITHTSFFQCPFFCYFLILVFLYLTLYSFLLPIFRLFVVLTLKLCCYLDLLSFFFCNPFLRCSDLKVVLILLLFRCTPLTLSMTYNSNQFCRQVIHKSYRVLLCRVVVEYCVSELVKDLRQ